MTTASDLSVIILCGGFGTRLREETEFVDFVRDRTEADVHVIITSIGTGSGGREYVIEFTGQGPFAGRKSTIKAVTGTGDPEDVAHAHRVRAQQVRLDTQKVAVATRILQQRFH